MKNAQFGRENALRRITEDGKVRPLQVEDEGSRRLPAAAHLAPVNRFAKTSAYFVPVSFVARDWKVTPRRIRTLLHEGRLQGRVMENGYWEVQYPYLYTFGTRGPALKRSQKPEARPV